MLSAFCVPRATHVDDAPLVPSQQESAWLFADQPGLHQESDSPFFDRSKRASLSDHQVSATTLSQRIGGWMRPSENGGIEQSAGDL